MKVVSLWRYPVKSMMGEELNSTDITQKGVYGDRAYGVIDEQTGKLANAKNPKKWPNMFQHRAKYIEPIRINQEIPPVYITLPTGETIRSDQNEIDKLLSKSLERNVTFQSPSNVPTSFEGYVPEEMEELEDRGTIFSRQSPAHTFFDIGMIHLVTTNTLEALGKLIPNSRIEARRFRPNIIVDVPDVEGFIEGEWIGKELHIGDNVRLTIVQPTKRCVMTTLAQGDLPNDMNVLKTVVKENSGNIGVYAEVKQIGTIYVGDQVKIV